MRWPWQPRGRNVVAMLERIVGYQLNTLANLTHVSRRLDTIERLLHTINRRDIRMANVLDDIQAGVALETDVVKSAILLLDNLTAKLEATGFDPSQVAAIVETMKTNREALAAAILANTPSAPTPPATGTPDAGGGTPPA